MYTSIVKSSTISLGTSALGYLLTTILAREYSETEFAQYLYIVAWSLFIGQFIDCGSLQCLTHFSKANRSTIEECWVAITYLKIFFLFSLVLSYLLIRQFVNIKIPILSFILLLPTFYLGNVYEYYGRNVSYALVGFFERLLNIMIAIIMVKIKVSLNWVLLFFVTSSVVSIIYQLKELPINVNQSVGLIKSSIAKYIGCYFLIYMVLISQLFYGNISRLIVEAKIGVIPFASLTLSFQLVNLTSIIQSQVDRYLRPLVADSIFSMNISNVRSIFYRYMLLYVFPLSVLAFLVALFSSEILKVVYGEKWEHASNVLKYACPQIATVAVLRFVDLLFTALLENVKNLIINMTSVALLVLTLWLNKSSDPSSFMKIISLTQLGHVVLGCLVVWWVINGKKETAEECDKI
jgi:O-antigen/teichoic acid export membrane protein